MNQTVIREPQSCPWDRVICVTVIQYITVSGGTCDVLSVIWQFAGEICFISPRGWLKQSPGVFVLCLWSDQRVSVKLSSRALAKECKHSREWKNKTPSANRTACSWWRAFLDQNSTSSLTQVHLYTTFHWIKSTSHRRTISKLILCRVQIWSAGSSSDGARCPVWYRSARFPWNTEQQSLKILICPGEQKEFVRFVR